MRLRRAPALGVLLVALAVPATACGAPAATSAASPGTAVAAPVTSAPVSTSTSTAAALSGTVTAAPVPARSTGAAPSRIVLTPTATPATSQRVSWSMPRRQAGQRVVFRTPQGSTRSTSAVRRFATSVTYSGTNDPRYTAVLTGLRPGTTYQYRIVTRGARTTWRAFTTAGGAGASTTIIALGDTQIDNRGVPRATVRAALAAEPAADLVLAAGDVVDRPYDDSQWRDLFSAIGNSGRTRNWVVSIGNHEQCVLLTGCQSKSGQAFRSYFDWPRNSVSGQGRTWFYVDYDDVRIVVLDSFGGRLADQAQFLDAALTDNPHRWSVVLMHAPPFATKPGRTNPEVRSTLLPIIESHDVDLVLSGHDHSYARGQRDPNGTVFAVSVSGPKYYEVSGVDWVANGAERARWAAQTSAYQVIQIDGSTLDYRAVVTATGPDTTSPVPVGGVLDHLRITKTSNGDKVVD